MGVNKYVQHPHKTNKLTTQHTEAVRINVEKNRLGVLVVRVPTVGEALALRSYGFKQIRTNHL